MAQLNNASNSPLPLSIDQGGTGAATRLEARENLSKVTTISSNITLGDHDFVLASGNITLSLPDAATCTNRTYTVKKTDSNATTVILDPSSSQTIDGELIFNLTEQYSTICIASNGSNWFVVSYKASPLPAYTIVNNSDLRAIDAQDVTMDELANIVSTLISDLSKRIP